MKYYNIHINQNYQNGNAAAARLVVLIEIIK